MHEGWAFLEWLLRGRFQATTPRHPQKLVGEDRMDAVGEQKPLLFGSVLIPNPSRQVKLKGAETQS